MKEEKFKVINYVRELIICIDSELDNFPKKDIEIKNRIRNNSFDLLEMVYLSNSISVKEKKVQVLQETVAKIKIIDFLINLCYDKKIINNKKYIQIGEKINDIIKYIAGWIKSIID